MSKPNFQAMSHKELHDYVLAHRENQEAFYAYVDKLHAEGNWVEMPPLESLQDLENYLSPKKPYLLRAGEQAQNLKLEPFSGGC